MTINLMLVSNVWQKQTLYLTVLQG